MTNSAYSKIGQTLLDVLYEKLGTDSDEIERACYALNPLLALNKGILPLNTKIILPSPVPPQSIEPQEFWQ